MRTSNKTGKKFQHKIPRGVSLYKKIIARCQRIYYVLFQLMPWLHFGVIRPIWISKKRGITGTAHSGPAGHGSLNRQANRPHHQTDSLLLLTKAGTCVEGNTQLQEGLYSNNCGKNDLKNRAQVLKDPHRTWKTLGKIFIYILFSNIYFLYI